MSRTIEFLTRVVAMSASEVAEERRTGRKREDGRGWDVQDRYNSYKAKLDTVSDFNNRLKSLLSEHDERFPEDVLAPGPAHIEVARIMIETGLDLLVRSRSDVPHELAEKLKSIIEDVAELVPEVEELEE